MPAKILVVDDDATVAEVVTGYLQDAGFEVAHACDGLEAVEVGVRWNADLVVLDVMLPGIDGFEVLRRLREHSASLPVILLTARGDEHDRVAGLELGADDYVTKPFSPRELALRVASVLRRSAEPAPARLVLHDGGLVVDVAARSAAQQGEDLRLTTREFDLLAFLLANPDRVFDRTELMTRVWGWSYGDESTVTVHVRRVREKVETDPARPTRLVTVWGAGYRWCSAKAAADE